MKATPGPWTVYYNKREVWGNCKRLCELPKGYEEYVVQGKEQRDANCFLLAAAPDLLEACKMALDYIADYCPEIGGTLTMTLDAAINKAAGKEG